MQAVDATNEQQKRVLFQKLNTYFKGDLAGKVVALWGLAFKPGTDDMREASSITLATALREAGAKIQAYDPVAMTEAQRVLGSESISFVQSKEECLEGADVLVIVTEWNNFRSPDFDLIKAKLKNPVIIDGRNMYDPSLLNTLGLQYIGIGRSNVELKA